MVISDYSTNDKNKYDKLILKNCQLFLGLYYFPINKNFVKMDGNTEMKMKIFGKLHW